MAQYSLGNWSQMQMPRPIAIHSGDNDIPTLIPYNNCGEENESTKHMKGGVTVTCSHGEYLTFIFIATSNVYLNIIYPFSEEIHFLLNSE